MLNGVDFAIIGVLGLVGYFFGFRKGMMGVAFFLLTYLASFLVATSTYEKGGELLAGRLGLSDIRAQFISFLLIFLVTSLAIRMLGLFLKHLAGWLNRLGGVASALLIGFIVIGIAAVYLYRNPSLASYPAFKDSILLRRAAGLVSQNAWEGSHLEAKGRQEIGRE